MLVNLTYLFCDSKMGYFRKVFVQQPYMKVISRNQ